MKIILNSQNFELSDTSSTFLNKYLERMKNFIQKNNIENEVYEDIEERIAEVFSSEKSNKIADQVVINIVNEIGEPDEIFSELIEEQTEPKNNTQNEFKNFFTNNGDELTRNSKEGIFFGVCYGISQKYNLDPLLVRLFFIFGTFLGGFTLLLYIVLIFLLPNRLDKKKDSVIIDRASELKDTLVEQGKKVGKKIESIEKKDVEQMKDSIVNKAKELGRKVNIEKIKNKISNTQSNETISNGEEKKIEIKEEIKNYSLSNQNHEIKEKIVYREVKPNFIVRFFRSIVAMIKNIILFIFHAGRYFLAFLILISAIPALIIVLFTSGLIFSDFTVNNQVLFHQIDFFLKIGAVGLLFSVLFGIFGIFLKLLSGKTMANVFMITGFIGIIVFAFIGGLGFFKTANKFTNTYSTTQTLTLETKDLKIIENDSFTNHQGINWINNFEFIPTNNENITIEVISTINRSSQQEADTILSQLKNIKNIDGNILDLSQLKKSDFNEVVPYSFLRKDIKIYIPKDVNIEFGNIHGDNIMRILNLDYINHKGDSRYLWGLHQCSNKIVNFDNTTSRYICVNKNYNNIQSEDIILQEVDVIIEEEINNIENITQ